MELVPNAKYPLRLVEADLLKPETWPNAVRHCTYVFHVASPLTFRADEDELIRTAVDGTINVLQACADAGCIKRVVATNSCASISSGPVGNPGCPPDYIYTEKDWSDESTCKGYFKSKLKSEQAAWEFVKTLDESKRFELVVLNPVYIQGPLLSASCGEVTQMFCLAFLNNSMSAIPDFSTAVVDVRDVAAAHIAALENTNASGKRYLLTNRVVHLREFSQIIGNEFQPQGYKIASKDLSKIGAWVGKFFNPMIKGLYAAFGKNILYNNEAMVSDLGIHPRPVEESILDTCYSLIDLSIAKRTPGYLGHPSSRS